MVKYMTTKEFQKSITLYWLGIGLGWAFLGLYLHFFALIPKEMSFFADETDSIWFRRAVIGFNILLTLLIFYISSKWNHVRLIKKVKDFDEASKLIRNRFRISMLILQVGPVISISCILLMGKQIEWILALVASLAGMFLIYPSKKLFEQLFRLEKFVPKKSKKK